jgi:hypothetical protein
MKRIAAALIGALCFVRGAASQPPPTQGPPPRATPPRAAPPRAAQNDAAAPDLAFLEYLGSWQGDDDEWIAIKEWDQDAAAPKGRPPDASAKPPPPPAKAKEPAPQ